MRKHKFFSLCLLITIYNCFSQNQIIPLWTENIPNQKTSNEVEKQYYESDIFWKANVQNPTLEVFIPNKRSATKKAVIICPGGAYHHIAYDWEGTDIAKWFNSKGITAFVLKYRLPESKSLLVNYKAPLQDAQRAVRLVRAHSEKWNLDKNQIGIMGFSAGGHLASTLGTHFDNDKNSISSPMDRISARPDFMVLIYPVITMKSNYTHLGSRTSLIGANPNQKLIDFYSNELQVTKNTPPTFILHSADDEAVSVMNSIQFYEALIKEGVSSEMHIYPKGGHGFGLAIGKGALQNWTQLLSDWMDDLK
ncbi:alpha/beta hydrolase [Tamlana sp. I1]|uniref:alpha/beta hydrolase n=1 Tax=Tamlana sp. I1 TaxID=2762061 RepID=UPI00188F7232|nr:alpha/beta hydrolase [Tamlana sp. I1]